MTARVVSYILSDKERFKSRFVLQCAPLLKGVKRSNAVFIEAGDVEKLSGILDGTAISYRILREEYGRCFVLFYRSFALEQYLNEPEVLEFLQAFGYEKGSLEKMLDRLSGKMQTYTACKETFPHELGVFLDYPLSDVKGFLAGRGRGELLSGYWKVYEDAEKAELLFRTYDWTKVSAVNEWFMGKTIEEIAR